MDDIIARSGYTLQRERGDILGLPLLGRLLRNRFFLLSVRLLCLALFVTGIYWGFALPGPRTNLVTPAIFWALFWPLFIVATLPFWGPVFCGICPLGFLGNYLTRFGLKKRLPKSLRSPYIGLALLIIGFWFGSAATKIVFTPLATAIIFLVTALVAAVIFFVFRGMSWCKYFCPIGGAMSAFGKTGFTRLGTYAAACDSCKTFDCARACQYELAPHRFDAENNMRECTLCLDCVQACDAVSWRFAPLSSYLRGMIAQMRRADVWMYILLLASVTVSMRFEHTLGRTAIGDHLPWSVTTGWLKETWPALASAEFNLYAVVSMLYALVVTVAISMVGLYLAARLLQRPFWQTFTGLGYALAPLMIFSALARLCEFFFLRFAGMLANGTIQLFSLPVDFVMPLAAYGDPWLRVTDVIRYMGIFWSFYLFYQRVSLVQAPVWRRRLALPAASLVVSALLALQVFTNYIWFARGLTKGLLD